MPEVALGIRFYVCFMIMAHLPQADALVPSPIHKDKC